MLQKPPSGFVSLVAALMIAAVLPGTTHGESSDSIVIELGDRVITRSEVDARFQVAVQLLARRQGISLADQDPAVIAALRDQYLDKYANELVFLKEAQRRQLEVSDEQVEQVLGQLIASEEVENEFPDETLLRRIVRDEQTIALLTEAMLQDIRIPPGDVITMHHDVKDSLATPEEICVRHIQTDSADAANDIRAKLELGADFAELAIEHSTDATSAGTGGDLGCFERSHSASRSEFEQAAFAAEEGQLVGPVESRLGYHILVVYEHKMPRAPTLRLSSCQGACKRSFPIAVFAFTRTLSESLWTNGVVMKNRARHLIATVFIPLVSLVLTTSAVSQELFPDALGRDTLMLVCTQCHSLGKMVAAELTAEDWQFIVYDMISRGAPVHQEDIVALTKYLQDNFAIDNK
jgi:parvulin-like peptidyl-prolyl isomerase